MIARLVSIGMAAVVCCAIILGGCSSKEKNPAVVKVVEDYCSVLQAVYTKLDLNLLVPVATENELKRIFPIVQALKSTDNIMKTEIGAFEVVKAEVASQGNSATVVTSERWKFWWEDRKSGTVTKQQKTENYQLQYTLVKDKGIWKVDKVRNLAK